MKKIQIPIALLLTSLLCGCITKRPLTHWHPAPEGIDPAVFACVIPKIEVHDATVEEAVGILNARWREELQSEKLPVTVLVRYADRDRDGKQDEIYEGSPGYRQKLTFTAVDITVAECLDLIDACSPHHLSILPGFLKFEQCDWIEEDWITTWISVSPTCRQALGLSHKTTSAELKAILQSYGVTFKDWMRFEWNADLSRIELTNLPREISTIRSLMFFLDQGFEIKKHNNRMDRTSL